MTNERTGISNEPAFKSEEHAVDDDSILRNTRLALKVMRIVLGVAIAISLLGAVLGPGGLFARVP